MQTQANQAEIKEKIAELKQRFMRLKLNCNSFARISPETTKAYSKEIQQLESKLN